MTCSVDVGTGPMCPRCGEDRLIEFDAMSRRWHCAGCSHMWKGTLTWNAYAHVLPDQQQAAATMGAILLG